MVRRDVLRLISLSSLIGIGILGGAVFLVKYQVISMRSKLNSINRQIVSQDEALEVLNAEWSYLNQPQRLQKLAQSHGSLRPPELIQLASLEDFLERKPFLTKKHERKS